MKTAGTDRPRADGTGVSHELDIRQQTADGAGRLLRVSERADGERASCPCVTGAKTLSSSPVVAIISRTAVKIGLGSPPRAHAGVMRWASR